MAEVFGEFFDVLPYVRDSLEITFTPSAYPVRRRWSTNRLSAQFIADYFAAFIPIYENEPDSERRLKEAKKVVSYIANELLENAMKFNYLESELKIKFAIYFLENRSEEDSEVTIVLHATNS
ncbi:MAG: ATP-binding protein, partial [Xenococcus sp. (in: cyanobacteria)]